MRFMRTTAALLALLLIVTCGLCACNNDAAPASSQGSSSEGYSSSAGVDMSGNTGTSTAAAGEIKFKNTLNWSMPYVYYWSDDDYEMTTWPGAAMTLTSDNIYTYTLPTGVGYIIFNDGSGTQTVDIANDGTVTEFQLSDKTDDDGKYYAASWSGTVLEVAKAYDSEQNVTNSDIAISVEKASVTDEYYTESFATNGGNDAVVFTVKNNSTDTIRELTLYVVFVDAQGNIVKPFSSYYSSNNIDVLTTRDVRILPGETKDIAYRCDADEFDKFDSIVASYLIDRTMYKNINADTWVQKYNK